ncbi:MAG: hypothetical protein Ct9H300mP25_02520 [Acidobacteriota bacterium]|nr:MAG: hypothetical protein Ct9H300mP25_02520 [Acidobacteriota bacterium]
MDRSIPRLHLLIRELESSLFHQKKMLLLAFLGREWSDYRKKMLTVLQAEGVNASVLGWVETYVSCGPMLFRSHWTTTL